MNVSFRTCSGADHADIERMALALYRELPGAREMDAQKIHATLARLERHPVLGRVVVFDIDGATVGYAILIGYWSNEHGGEWINVDEIYVEPGWRGREIGTRFLRHLEAQHAPSERGIQLEVAPGGERALAFYARLGFERAANAFLQKPFER